MYFLRAIEREEAEQINRLGSGVVPSALSTSLLESLQTTRNKGTRKRKCPSVGVKQHQLGRSQLTECNTGQDACHVHSIVCELVAQVG